MVILQKICKKAGISEFSRPLKKSGFFYRKVDVESIFLNFSAEEKPG
jgi:hypothetical protein